MSGQAASPPTFGSLPAESPPSINGSSKANGGNDAVCFTAGFVGSTFGAGTIHAYLAADRNPPLVAAGISMGAITAAAMQRVYQELKEAQQQNLPEELARWRWFRQYLLSLADKPFSVIWDGLPKQSDFFADMIPVKDPAIDEFRPTPPPGQQESNWRQEELTARRERYLFVRLGSWLASLPLPLSRLASLLVTYVRIKERVPGWSTFRRFRYFYLLTSIMFVIARHVCFSPHWFPEYKFQDTWYRKLPRPLFGWLVYLASWIVFLVLLLPMLVVGQVGAWQLAIRYSYVAEYLPWLKRTTPVLVRWFPRSWPSMAQIYSDVTVFFCDPQRVIGTLTEILAVVIICLIVYRWVSRAGVFRAAVNTLIEQFLRNVELERALVYDFHLRIKLTSMFEKEGKLPLVGEDPMPIVLVAAPLQRIQDRAGNLVTSAQLWASPQASLIDALCTAISQPALFRPLNLKNSTEIRHWLTEKNRPLAELDLVDGNVVRENPIPALFKFLKDQKPEFIERLTSTHDDPRIHVVYNVPIHGQSAGKEHDLLGMNIVDVVRTSLQLNKRRDTQLEVEQTNFIGRLEEDVRRSGRVSSRRAHPIFADKIAPERPIVFDNQLAPRPEEILTKVAEGCRRSLETLYRKELGDFATSSSEVRCPVFIAQIAEKRRWVGHPYSPPGLPEVCSRCSQWLAKPREEKKPQPEPSLVRDFPTLTGSEPRIVFLASGGVFRGPFHGGMLACLLASQIRPHMIIGASVGTLMGGALGAVLSAPAYSDAIDQLASILTVFAEVDRRIAFTRTLKSAVREIGIRARSIDLSPNKLRRLIRGGGRSDPGFATTGAPAALIDALSDLLMIPHRNTAEIAGQFVAGHISAGTKMLLEQLKAETLRRLEIEDAVIGTSLLEVTAYKLLGGDLGLDLHKAQPFFSSPEKGIAFFGTTTDLVSEEPLLLGRYNVPGGEGTYNFVEAALASSAFPGVFAPRRESEVFPGAGKVDVLLSDGGMFDNLPFLPAIEVLGAVQRVYRKAKNLDSLEFLRCRHQSPDLFIAGSLNVRPERDDEADATFDDLITIAKRAGSLQDNVKIRDFQDLANTVGGQLDLLLSSAPEKASLDPDFIDGIVDATVLPVFPVDRNHLNPTFAFCASTGMDPERVKKSIADGCFQTFATFAEAQRTPPSSDEYKQPARSIAKLKELGRIPEIKWARESGGKITGDGRCPFFRHSADTEKSQAAKVLSQGRLSEFNCPFYATKPPIGHAIFKSCSRDSVHLDEEALHPPPETILGKAANRAYRVARRI
jgi:predicted acylesterase/phospholipase RssA